MAARILGEALPKWLGQPVVVDNRPGAGGTIGGLAVMQAPADGCMLMLSNTTPIALGPFALGPFALGTFALEKQPCDPVSAFTHIASLGNAPPVIMLSARAGEEGTVGGLEAGADDVITTDEGFEVRCEVTRFDKVLQALDQAGIKTASAEIAYIPTTTVPVSPAVAASIEKLHDSLDEHDDVQHVFSNEDAPL